jgi:acetyl-CoA synthetase
MNTQITSLQDYFNEYHKSITQPEKFWGDIAGQFVWFKKWDKTLEWNFESPDVKWFQGGLLNITTNSLDRHIASKGDKPAIIWEPNEIDEAPRIISYRQLLSKTTRFANVLKSLGVKKGDTVCIYMPMVPEVAVAMLACARIGAIHSVVFAGFSSNALAERILDCDAKVVITADAGYRGPKEIPIKSIVDEALTQTPGVKTCIVYPRIAKSVPMQNGRDHWWDELMIGADEDCPAEPVDAEHPLFILYTSGSTGKPKGVVHATGGYMVYTEYTFRNVFQYRENDVFFCTADVGWITGHSYLLYGALLNGATTVFFEGIPTHPNPGRFWHIVDKYKVNIFYTAPTAIRSLQAYGREWPEKYDLSSLRVLGSVGEPINEEAWHWYHAHVGRGRCPITDTWWQTETGGIMMAPLAGITPTKPGYATLPLPGIRPVLLDNDGNVLEGKSVEGNLCIAFPWPSIIRTTWGDHERCRQTYFSTYKNLYFTGDGCRRDEDGYYRILGRVDDVINVSGHRMGTAEIENAINEHPLVNESAVVGYPHSIKGQGIYAYVTVDKHYDLHEQDLKAEILQTVVKLIGPIAKPDTIQIVRSLPKTRSGKIMRRILRKIAEGDTSSLGDTSTLLDPSVVEEIIAGKG